MFTLPIIQQPEKNRKIRVIITDDHSLYRNGLKKSLLKFSDIEVVGDAENGKQLLEMLAQQEADIVTLDLQMPVMDGLAALPIIRRNFPGIKVIIVCMHTDWSVIAKMMELGAHSYITVGEGPDQVYKAIIECCEKDFFITNIMKQALLNFYYDRSTEFNLTNNETCIIQLLSENKAVQEIAGNLNLSPRTISAIISRMLVKTHTSSIEEMVKTVNMQTG